MNRYHCRFLGTIFLSLGTMFFLACGSEQDLDYQCEGKCEGALEKLGKSFKAYYGDVKNIQVSDLVGLSAKLITSQINDQLDDLIPSYVTSNDWGSVSASIDLAWAPIQIYSTTDKANKFKEITKLEQNLKYLNYHDIEEIRSGLMARYGDKSFVTHITQLRTQFLIDNPGYIFTESKFRLSGSVAPRLNLELPELPGWVGLDVSKGLEATVIAPYDAESLQDNVLAVLVKSPVEAFKQMRSFFLPTQASDLKKMASGETIVLKTNGTVALNVGMGLPIHITTIANVATLQAVLSVGASVTLGGKQLDVQIIREKTDDLNNIIVDVGILEPEKKSLDVALKTKWGVEGLEDIIGSYTLDLGVWELDAVDFAEKALNKLLDKSLKAQVGFSTSTESIRHTISRFRFDADKCNGKDQEVEQAMIQAIFGDLRLAQALSFKEGSGVTQPVALMRNIDRDSTRLGAEFLSLKFYTEEKNRQAAILISKDGEDQRVLMEELVDADGFWLTEHAATRRVMSSVTAVNGTPVDADHNMGLMLFEHDSFMKRDQILDHVDPLLAYFIGQHNFRNRLAPITDALESYVNEQCPPVMENFDSDGYNTKVAERKTCLAHLSSDPNVSNSVKAANEEFEAIMKQVNENRAFVKANVQEGESSGFILTTDDPQKADEETFARKLFELKLAVQSSYQFPTINWLKGLTFEGPESALLVDYRMSASALHDLFADGARFRQSLKDTLAMTHIYRRDYEAEGDLNQIVYDWVREEQKKDIEKELENLEKGIDALVSIHQEKAKQYNLYHQLANDKLSPEGRTIKVGDQAQLAIVEERTSNVVDMVTIADRKAEIARDFFDEIDKQYSAGDTGEQVLSYGLLACTSPKDIELTVEMKFEKTKDTNHPNVNLYGVGENIKLINAGEYDIKALFDF